MMPVTNCRRRLKSRFYKLVGFFPYFGVRTYFPADSLVFLLACEQGIYEADNLHLLRTFARDGTTVFDIGANIGLMSIPLLCEHPKLRVVSFEPSPAARDCLARTVRESGYANRWISVSDALSDKSGTASFECGAYGAAFDGMKSTGRGGATTAVQVTVATLDQVWNRLGKPSVSVVKIDVEGHELSVLRGGTACFTHTRPAVLIEWCLRNLAANHIAPGELLEWAVQTRYRVLALPELNPVSDAVLLDVQLRSGRENFLLVPSEGIAP